MNTEAPKTADGKVAIFPDPHQREQPENRYDILRIESVFNSSIYFLHSQGVLKEKEDGTEIVASCHDGVEVSVTSHHSMQELQDLSRERKLSREEIILSIASHVRVSAKDEEPFKLNKFDPTQFNPAQIILNTYFRSSWWDRELEEQLLLRRGVEYSVYGNETQKDLNKRVSQLQTWLFLCYAQQGIPNEQDAVK